MKNTNLKQLKTVAGKLKKASKAHAKQSATLSRVVKNVSKKRK